MIRVENLSFAFTEQQIFSQLCLSVQRGDFLTILGPNGCGKSTLLRLLRGTLKPQSGGIIWNGIPLEKITAREMARTVDLYLMGESALPEKGCCDLPRI